MGSNPAGRAKQHKGLQRCSPFSLAGLASSVPRPRDHDVPVHRLAVLAPQVRGDAPPVMGGTRRTDLPEPPPPPPIKVEQLALGKLVGKDKAPFENIQPSDKLYAQLDTQGVGQVMVRVKWSRIADGKLQVINEGGRVVVGNGPDSHVFEIHNAEGWKPGEYQVEVFVDDTPLATRRFGVQ